MWEESDPRWSVAWALGEGEARARDFFRATFGYAADSVTSSPGRVNLIGDHTDYNGGMSLSTILTHRTYVAANRRDDTRIRIASAQGPLVHGPDAIWEGDLLELTTDPCAGWVRHAAGVLWALAERGFPATGIDIVIDSCVPIAAGLGSSAALQTAVALAANSCWDLSLDSPEGRIELASAAMDAEARYVGVPTGGLDQHTVLRCGTNEATLIDFATSPPTVKHLPLYIPDYGLCLLMIDTQQPHNLGDGQFANRKDACERAAAALGAANLREVFDAPHWLQRVNSLADPELRTRARHVVTEMHRVRLITTELSGTAPAHERFIDVGKALYRSHASLDVDFGVSTEALNLAVDESFRAGALGARLVGAGFGGTAAALIRRDQVPVTARFIDQAFIAHGLTRPRFLTRIPHPASQPSE